MRYLTVRMRWGLFGLAMLLLICVAIAADRSTNLFADSARWVSHSREVETELARVQSDLLAAESGRQGYIISGTTAHLERFEQAKLDLPERVKKLKALTSDNPLEQQRVDLLGPMIERRLALLDESITLRKGEKPDREKQDDVTVTGIQRLSEVMAVLDEMKQEEARLLRVRQQVNDQTYLKTRMVLVISFAVVVLLFFANFRQLLVELKDRKRAEDSVRRLSGRLLQLQDAERRKVARELHDSIGQYFAGLKMDLDMLANGSVSPERQTEILARSVRLLDQGIAETRTLSHLLHPPMLDEIGFASAAIWYVEGFSARSKINVALELPEHMKRMPRELELVMFRVLQEGLTNIHRHSESAAATVRLESKASTAKLIIQDYGKGIPEDLLEEFRRTSTGTGVGLAGMRERVTELGGRLDVECNQKGTCLSATVPLPQEEESASPNPRPEGQKESQLKEGPPGSGPGLMLTLA